MRTLASLLALVLLVGCAGRGHGARSRAGVFGRPGDADRASILGLERGERVRTASPDPLPSLARSDFTTEPLGAPRGARAAGGYEPRAPYRSPLLGRWRLAGDGDLSMPLEGAWRVRVGLSAGGTPPENALPEPGRRSEGYLAPGLRLERDL